MSHTAEKSQLHRCLEERVLVLDGAMGTMIQRRKLGEADFRAERFSDHPSELLGNNDLLVLTRPDVIEAIHREYLEAGADIIETNTFNAQRISQADYGTEALAFELNRQAARVARRAADAVATDARPRFVAGAIGPMNRALSLSPKVEDPGYRAVTYSEVYEAYAEQVDGLLDGGVDLFLVETIFDTLNAKAALHAIRDRMEKRGIDLPIMISVTITDASGRTLSGQTLEAFHVSIEHARPISVGINCAFGGALMAPYVEELSRMTPFFLSAYPNAGLPNEFGEYDEEPEDTAVFIRDWADNGWVNVVGGCCGTTPDHIAAMVAAVEGKAPRTRSSPSTLSRFSGLEPYAILPETSFTMIGERTNVTGSRRFARLIKSEDYETALAVARQQVEGGANILDVNMDEGLLDSPEAMRTFLNLVAAEPDICRIPLMIDSSDWAVIEAGLQCVQGKSVVNSISLKEGEAAFREQATLVHRYGAAVLVMAFDEQAQATGVEDRLTIAKRAYRILTEEIGFAPQDIVFDPNILAVATGIEEHADYAKNFIEATRAIKGACPGMKISGGVSNLSFSFRGNDRVREAMHAAFLYHAIAAGMDMGIVNAGQLAVYREIDADLLVHVEDVILNRRPDATERLVSFAESVSGEGTTRVVDDAWRQAPVEKRLEHLIDIFAGHVLREDPEATLTIVGDGHDHSNLVARAMNTPYADRFHFPGEVRHANLVDWYGHGDVFVYTSLSETFGNVVNEALWCGLPAVALDDRMGVAHQIADEVNGFLVEPDREDTDEEFASACLLLSRSSTLRQQMGEQGANLSRRSSHPDIVISRFEAIYERAKAHCVSTVPNRLADASRAAQMRAFAFHISRWAMWNTAVLGIAYTATAVGAGRHNDAEQNAKVQTLMQRRQAESRQQDAA